MASVQKHLSVKTEEGVENSEKLKVRKPINAGEEASLIDTDWD